MRNTKFIQILAALSLIIASGCGSSGSSSGGGQTGLTLTERIDLEIGRMRVSNATLTLDSVLLANLAQPAPVASIYGTVTQGTALNVLNDNGLQFLVYGDDGVFAAECEPSALDPTYGPTHPFCQTEHAENYDNIIVCFANTDGAGVIAAQVWPGPAQAFDSGHGMICYARGLKMRSSHIYTY